MPGMNGIEATRQIRGFSGSHDMRIIGTTGLDDSKTMRDCREAGMDDILVKPLRERELESLNLKLVKMLIDPTLLCDLDSKVRDEVLAEWQRDSYRTDESS